MTWAAGVAPALKAAQRAALLSGQWAWREEADPSSGKE